ncbi:hypothetical protein UFOVP1082_43 [uncultured Caudovirales phage]|uniref:Uncharacterized protein n=1 Tax=uncultured Caudovirales phage TaxID=2100421 RepID=A0A6J5RTP6_9CAUD|nr:hypothetical protein UFOVP906_21 [uncultured Caudovirales phage]CAB4176630.1 hypothetical protein UFOVP992_47 [uncultured Caudovirales phage]CAB4183433.1 hypothetical protein UFOVP1082_43 [uncultured Caudovirales phage]CAB4197546.1 hypothetical protein UFOVP1322_28 [uncultured Caudovirales phage]CAB4212909.1 hypothetical protein UFOVP1434_50 [uncultured Caudovirales phage]
MSVESWCGTFMACHAITANGVWRTAWPDGEAYWVQDGLTVNMFHILMGELVKELNANAEQQRN